MALRKITEKTFPITQLFGKPLYVNRKSIYYPMKGHNGVDYGTPMGTPLMAPIEGKVEVKNDGKFGYGLHVKIFKTRTDGISEVILAHLSDATVKTGDVVKPGNLIGYSGGASWSKTSGTSTGPHLHLGLRFRDLKNEVIDYKNGYYGWIDPLPYFEK